MSTAAIAPSDKAEQAAALRTELVALTKEVSQAREKLSAAQRTLGALEEKRRELAEAIADGKPQTAAVGEIHAKIAEAQLPIGPLEKRVAVRQKVLDETKSRLEVLLREISMEEQLALRQRRYDELVKRGGESVARLNEQIRSIIETLADYDEVRESLLGQFASFEANQVVNEFGRQLFEASYTKVERSLLRQGWQMKGTIRFEITNLRRPK